MRHRYLGIDPSTHTGVVVLEYNEKKQRVKTKLKREFHFPKAEGLERLDLMVNEVLRIVGEHDPDGVVIEGYSYQSKFNITNMVEIGILIRYFLWKNGVEFVDVAPTQLKKFVTKKGNCAKDLVLKEVFRNWGFDTENDNVADAFGLAMFGVYSQLGFIDEKGLWRVADAKSLNYC